MGGVCLCYSWTCRPVWPLFIILATLPCMLHCSESPAAGVGKMYPRGNHWAVGKRNFTFLTGGASNIAHTVFALFNW